MLSKSPSFSINRLLKNEEAIPNITKNDLLQIYEKNASKHYKIFASIVLNPNINLRRKIANLKAVKHQYLLEKEKGNFWENEINAMNFFITICEKRGNLAIAVGKNKKDNPIT